MITVFMGYDKGIYIPNIATMVGQPPLGFHTADSSVK
jgi:hypothetical protein